ncbi:hypothetical protein F4808DRAFT_445798 [Astrocystis sublimbata]|nr:hypothetical protein F4808DRAFT_445798 [Astrocystis sublimbata]
MDTLTPNASKNFVLCIVLIAFTSACLILRLFTNYYRRKALSGPDWFCIVATIVFNVYCGLIIQFIFNESQFHAFDLDLTLGATEVTNLLRFAFITEILFTIGITAIKLSILWFYYTLFSINRQLNPIIKATAVLVVAWFFAAILVLVLQCNPVSAFWEHFLQPPYCLETPRVLLGYEISNLFIDVAVLCIPVTTVWQLQIPVTKKLSILGIFLLGTVTCIASIFRLTAIWNPPNVMENFDFGQTYVWTTLQLGLAIITCCLPTYAPLIPLFPGVIRHLCGYYKTMRYPSTAGRSQDLYRVGDASHPDRPWVRVGDEQPNAASQSWAYGNNSGRSDYPLQPMHKGAIVVDTRVDVV